MTLERLEREVERVEGEVARLKVELDSLKAFRSEVEKSQAEQDCKIEGHDAALQNLTLTLGNYMAKISADVGWLSWFTKGLVALTVFAIIGAVIKMVIGG
jgi:hypothetical protein